VRGQVLQGGVEAEFGRGAMQRLDGQVSPGRPAAHAGIQAAAVAAPSTISQSSEGAAARGVVSRTSPCQVVMVGPAARATVLAAADML